MANTTALPPVPNPFTPFAYLPLDIAPKFEVSIYIFVGCLSAYICEWILSMGEEIKLFRKRGVRPVIVAYFLSRIGSVSYALSAVLLYAAPLPNCNAVMGTIGASFVVAVPSTSAMFFFRLKAVYNNDMVITVVFGFLLLALFGLSFFVPVFARATHIAMTRRCINVPDPDWITTPIILSCVFDTMVFIAISMRIVSSAIKGDTFPARVMSFFKGAGLPALSRSVLHGGQLYYFTTISLNLWLAISILAPVSPIYSAMFSVPNITLASCMACRVFRAVRMGRIRDDDMNSTLRTARSSRPSTNKYAVNLGPSSPTVPVAIQMTKTVESGEPYSNARGRTVELYPDGHSDDKIDVAFGQV